MWHLLSINLQLSSIFAYKFFKYENCSQKYFFPLQMLKFDILPIIFWNMYVLSKVFFVAFKFTKSFKNFRKYFFEQFYKLKIMYLKINKYKNINMIILINNKIKRVEDSNLFKVPFLRTPFLRSAEFSIKYYQLFWE